MSKIVYYTSKSYCQAPVQVPLSQSTPKSNLVPKNEKKEGFLLTHIGHPLGGQHPTQYKGQKEGPLSLRGVESPGPI